LPDDECPAEPNFERIVLQGPKREMVTRKKAYPRG
jgi:hypothetical protein